MGEGEEGGGKAAEVLKQVTNGAENSGRRQIVVTIVAMVSMTDPVCCHSDCTYAGEQPI